MRMLAEQSGDKRLKRVMEEASEKVASGSTVASALEEYSERFPLTFIETIRAGEQSGTLDRPLNGCTGSTKNPTGRRKRSRER